MYKAQNEIRHILTSHEQGAAHAADGYARATGKTGVCIATSGPGATNLDRYRHGIYGLGADGGDHGPGGNALLGKDSFQEVDITGITMPITKHNYIVKDVNELADTVRQAFRIASDGRPGPVLIDICKDVTAAYADYEPVKPSGNAAVPLKSGETPPGVNESQLNEAAAAVNSAMRPVILSGGGVSISGATAEMQMLAEKAGILLPPR